MAGNLPVSNGAEVKLVWALNGVPASLNILHFTHPVGGSMNQTVADSISTIVRNAVTASGLAGVVYTGVSLLRVESRHMDSNSDPWYVGAGAAVAGTGAGNPLPAATSFVVSLLTGLRGRSFNGRVYLWGFTEDANDAAGGITSAASVAAVSFVQQINSGMNSTLTYTQGVLSRFTTPPGAAAAIERTPPLMTPLTNIVAKDLRWDVQRRRAVPGI